MKRRTVGEILFWGATAGALALYWMTAPDGLPWNPSAISHPIWRYFVAMAGGNAIVLSCLAAAVSGGLIAAMVNRYLGWRLGVAAALVWIFLPGVWNRAITGERGICLAAMCVVAAWTLNAVALRVLKKARKVLAARKSVPNAVGGDVLGAPSAHDEKVKRGKVNRIAGWVALGAAVVFAVVSLTLHDYRYGEAASVFARGVVEAAGVRCIVLSGVCDDQIVREVEREKVKVEGQGQHRNFSSDSAGQHSKKGNPPLLTLASDLDLSCISLRNDDAYRTNLVRLVRSAFPSETNLWVAAQVSPKAFVDAAIVKYPDRFYLMNGKSTTFEAWEKRWEAFKPYLESSDPFVREARRMFGYEGNAVGNAICDGEVRGQRSEVRQRNLAIGAAAPLTSGQETASPLAGQRNEKGDIHCLTSDLGPLTSSTAWQLYKRIYTEIDPGNFSALVNMSEMIRRGHAVSGEEKKKVQEKLEQFFKDANNRKHMRDIARAAGPVRADPALMEKLAAEAKRRIAAKIAAGEKVGVNPEILTLVEWNDEMCQCMDKGELAKAGRIARAILSNPKWRGFIPANAVMGSVASYEGDYVASERFFQVATDTTNKVVSADLNNYADTLMHLGKLDEAEKVARRAVNESSEKFWLARLTLAEVLEKKEEEKVKAGGQGQEGKIDEAALAAFAVGGVKEVKKRGGGGQRNLTSGAAEPLNGAQGQSALPAGQHNKKADVHCPPPPTFSTSSDEIRTLLKSVLKYAPEQVREKIRKDHKGYVK